MKKQVFSYVAALLLFLIPGISFGQVITLGTASNFVLFTTAGAITNSGTGYLTHLTGNVGSNSGSSTGFGNVDGSMHDGDVASGAAATDLAVAYSQLNLATPTSYPSSTLGGGSTFLPGVYSVSTAATLNGTLTLNANGNPSAVFIIQINGALSVGSNARVIMTNGGQACNVYWKVEGLVSVGTGSSLKGTIVAHNAAISMGTLDTLEGRALSLNGAITMNSLMAYTPLGCGTGILTGPTAPTFGAVGIFALFSSIGPVSNGGAITHVTGDVGTNLGLTTGFNPLYVTGTIHPIPDGVTAAAVPALASAYSQLNILPVDIELLYPAQFGHNLVLTPHTYLLNAATALTDTLYLNAEGNPNAVFVIKINGALSTSPGAVVMLVNGTKGKNVYWKVEGAVSLSNNVTFYGTIVANNGAIDLTSGDKFYGRALTTDGALTTNGITIIADLVPAASPITGDSTVCVGSSIPLMGATAGGTWSSNSSNASVTNMGIVTGVTPGVAIISYITSNTYGSDTATKNITVNAQPNAGTITGPSGVCIGSSITLNDTATGGTWSASNANATVVNGIVTGVVAGVDSIKYTVINLCGTAVAAQVVTIYAIPTVNTITNQTLCNGTQTTAITFTGSATTYSWANNNTAIGLVASGTGNILAFTATNTTAMPITATVTVTPSSNGCTGSSKSFTITVNPSPNVATVSNQVVCNGTLTAPVNYTGTVAGTTYSWTNDNSSIGLGASGTGNIAAFTATNTTIIAALANITVTPTANSCSGNAKTFSITVNPSANVSTVGNQVVCNGTSTSAVNFNGTVAGTTYSWANNNTSIGLAASGAGNIAAFTATNTTSAPVVSTVTVTPTASGCAGVTTSFTITVNPSADVTAVANQIVCNGTLTTPINYTGSVSGTTFSWVNNNATIGLATSGTGNIAAFTATNTTNAANIGTIIVTPSANSCTGASKTFTITVNPTPDVATIANQVICNGALTSAVIYSGTVVGTSYSWANNNTTIGLGASGIGNISAFTATNTTNAPVIGTIVYTPTANACVGLSKSFTITVNPTPTISPVADQAICNGAATIPINFTGSVNGTSYSWINSNTTIGLAGFGMGNIASFTAINTTSSAIVATISVVPLANGCTGATSTFTITVNPTPVAPIISLTTPPSVCDMTYFRNFGAATLPPTGINYSWSTINAAVSDTGKTQQYVLINFKNPGTATVILTATDINTGCLNKDTHDVNVTSNVADVPAKVIYFTKSFVVLQNNEEAYSWGYDDSYTLAPTLIPGELNQDYVNANPDFANHNYWAMVTHDGCIQKTYYNKPTDAVLKPARTEVIVTPNPASQQVNIAINTSLSGDIQMDIVDMKGQKVYAATVIGNNATVDISSLPVGIYIIACYNNHERISFTRFMKN